MERINNFDFIVKYVKGENLPQVDALSRNWSLKSINLINDELIDEKIRDIVLKKHEELIHRGKNAVIYDLKKSQTKYRQFRFSTMNNR